MPCWTCPSFDSLGRCPLPSESSWTTHSEDTSSPSFGPSYTDLQVVSAGEQSGLASGADSTGKREPQARGLCKSLLVASHQISAASFVCRMMSGVVVQWRKPEPSVFQNCVGENTCTQTGWLVGRFAHLGNHLPCCLKGLSSDCSVQAQFPVGLFSPWVTERCVMCARLKLSSHHLRASPVLQREVRFKQRKK